MRNLKEEKKKKVKCWEIFACNKQICPAYGSKNLNCWLFSGTHCRDEIQGMFLEKMEMCLSCDVFKVNMDVLAMKDSLELLNIQLREFSSMISERDRELEKISMELAIGLSETFEALKKISSGDPTVRLSEVSKVELISKLKHLVNMTAKEIGEIVDHSHEIAIDLSEYFDVLHRVSLGDLNARVQGKSPIELSAALKKVTNEMVDSIEREINDRKKAEGALQKAYDGLELRVQERTAKLTEANIKLKRENIKRRQADKALLESEKKYKTLTESSLTGIFIHQDGNFVFVNDRFAEIHGYRPEELLGKDHILLIHPDDRNTMREIALKRLKGKIVPQRYEARRVKKSGRAIWCEMMVTRIKFNGRVAIMGNIIDITERKLADDAIKKSEEQLRNLTTYLQRMAEIERTNIAREIHDELGQALTVLKMEISWFKKKVPENRALLTEKTEAMLKLINKIIQTVKKISWDLRPSLLDDFGLAAAIEWQAGEFEKLTGIKCRIKINPEDISFDRDRNNAIFRIFQETLTNIARHAAATEVRASLKQKDGQIEMKVRDNGRGISKEEVAHPKSFGLIGIRERAKIFGGNSTIKGIAGKGTTVTVKMPSPSVRENL